MLQPEEGCRALVRAAVADSLGLIVYDESSADADLTVLIASVEQLTAEDRRPRACAVRVATRAARPARLADQPRDVSRARISGPPTGSTPADS
jgi:hypothetical protein